MYSNLPTCVKISHSILIVFVWLLIYAICSAYNAYIFFNDSFLPGGLKAIKYIVSLIFYFSTIMAIICHTLTILTDPGSLNYDLVDKLQPEQKTRCEKCQKDRPLRAHHCRICKRCIMKMDHHCPWVFNCVGFGNHKIFFLFICYTLLGLLIAMIMFIVFLCSDSFKEIYRNRKSRRLDFGENNMRIFGDSFKKIGDVLMIIIALIFAFFTFCSVFTLFISQIVILTRNITNIESDKYVGKQNNNPFYAETHRCFLFKALLGLNEKWKWFFPIVEPNLYHGGYVYITPFKKEEFS